MNSPAPKPDRHVVVISLDGFPAFMWSEPDLPVPNLRRLAAQGARAAAMRETTPASTWSSHTSLITGRSPRAHGVFYLGQLRMPGPGQRAYVEQWTPKVDYVKAPTLYDVAHAAGLTTAESDWVAITGAPTVTWPFPEIPSVGGKVEQEMIAAGLLTAEQIGFMQHRPGRKSLVFHDQMWARAACFVFEKHRPNLMLFHNLTLDAANHDYGHGSMACYLALAYADHLVGEILAAVARSGVRDRTTVFITSDHGFKHVQRLIHPNVALRQAGYVTKQGAGADDWQATAISVGGMAGVHLCDPASQILPELKTLFSKIEGIERVLEAGEAPSLGLPTKQENPGIGDLILIAADGYEFANDDAGDAVVQPVTKPRGTHGYPATDPAMDGIFIATGAGIKPGVTLPRISSLDVAPTIARLLGLTMPDPEGRVLEEIWS